MRPILLFLVAATTALPATINFDDQPDLTPVTNQYLGVTFANATVLTAGISLNEIDFPPHSGDNVAFDDGGPITITLGQPTGQIGFYTTYVTQLTVQAFDDGNNLLATLYTLFTNNTTSQGDQNSNPNEHLQIIAPNIKTITIQGDPNGASYTIDDVSFTTPVPEAGSLSMLLVGALSLSCIGRFRSRNP